MLTDDLLRCPSVKPLRGGVPAEHFAVGVEKDDGIIPDGVVMTTPVIDNPYGGAFRNNRRPTVVPGVDPLLSSSDKRFYLNPAAFTFPTPGQFGNLGRYAVHGPGLSQVDFTLHNKLRFDEKRNL